MAGQIQLIVIIWHDSLERMAQQHLVDNTDTTFTKLLWASQCKSEIVAIAFSEATVNEDAHFLIGHHSGMRQPFMFEVRLDLITDRFDRGGLVTEVFVSAGNALQSLCRAALERWRQVLEKRLHTLVHCPPDVVSVVETAPDVSQGTYAFVQMVTQPTRIVLNIRG